MPIEDRGYRRREPRQALRGFRAWPIARMALRQVLGRRAVWALFALALVPFVIGLAVAFGLSRFPEMAVALGPLPRLYSSYLGLQTFFAFLVTLTVGCGLVADDL